MSGLKMWLPFSSSQQLGEELVVNGNFAADTIWIKSPSGVTITGSGFANFTSGQDTYVFQTIMTIGKRYSISLDYNITSISTGYFGSNFGSGSAILTMTGLSGSGTLSGVIVATSNLLIIRSSTFDGTITNVSVKEVGQFSLDETTNNNNAKLLTGNCLDFDGTNDYLNVSGFTMSGSNATFAFWANTDSVASTGFIFDANPNRFLFGFQGGPFKIYDGSYYTFGTISLNQWHRIIVIINGTSAKCFVDGVQLGSTQTMSSSIDLSSATEASIGSRYNGASAFYNGSLSDFQIWDAVWSATDVANDYAKPNEVVSSVPAVNLVGYWAMTEGNGGLAYDSSSLLSAEKVTNGDFGDGTTGWSASNSTISIEGGALKITSTGGNRPQSNQTVSGLVVGKQYKLSAVAKRGTTSNDIEIEISGIASSSNSNRNSTTVFETIYYIFTATSTSHIIQAKIDEGNEPSGTTAYFDNISLKQVTPADNGAITNGATWLTAQSTIPQLGMMDWSKGSNIFPFSEDFENSDWTKNSGTTITNNYAISPNGDLSASRYLGTGASGIGDKFTLTAVSHTLSFYVKSNTSQNQFCALLGDSNQSSGNIQVTTDWARISHTFTASGQANKTNGIFRDSSNNNIDILIWGAQLEVGTSAGNYRKTNGTEVTNAILPPYPVNPTTDVLGNTLRARLNSLNLTGTGYAEVADDNSLDFGTGDFSVEAWVKYQFLSQGASSYNAIYTNGGQVNATNNFSLTATTPNKIRFLVNNVRCTSTSTFTEGEWVHIVGSRESGAIKLYINGNTTPEATETDNNTVTNALVKMIGFDTYSERYYNNLIDDVRVYNRAILATEVEQNYKAGLSAHTN